MKFTHWTYQAANSIVCNLYTTVSGWQFRKSKVIKQMNKPVGDTARAYTGDADAVIDYGLLIAT